MLRVKTKLKYSDIEGIGLFADEFIPAGTVTWKYDPEFDSSYFEEDLERIPPHVKQQFLKYSYFDYKINKYILCSDDQRFINHSRTPNIQSIPEMDTAIIDIQIGEELLCNYEHYESKWFERRGIINNFL